ncbi:MAG: hypothetical protein D084_Lepto4C00246G0001 [Leptospirillum sp. Group IV 'UBA BS']|nr:MAG: hypothetical protein D084_Lepto4C00246G0001 [Leptospirillum sp. Group IV 'UBA BS']
MPSLLSWFLWRNILDILAVWFIFYQIPSPHPTDPGLPDCLWVPVSFSSLLSDG